MKKIKKTTKKNSLQVNVYRVLSDCVERGVEWGMSRAYKYEDNPSKAAIIEEIENSVMHEISEKFIF